MPPWLPEPGFGEFAGERRLTAGELGLLQQWAAEGAAEGPPGTAPKPPEQPDGWLLGKPDLVLKMEQPYLLGADGSDVYRNFVIPVSLERTASSARWKFSPEIPGPCITPSCCSMSRPPADGWKAARARPAFPA